MTRPEGLVAADICLWLALHGYRQVRCVAGVTRALVKRYTAFIHLDKPLESQIERCRTALDAARKE